MPDLFWGFFRSSPVRFRRWCQASTAWRGHPAWSAERRLPGAVRSFLHKPPHRVHRHLSMVPVYRPRNIVPMAHSRFSAPRYVFSVSYSHGQNQNQADLPAEFHAHLLKYGYCRGWYHGGWYRFYGSYPASPSAARTAETVFLHPSALFLWNTAPGRSLPGIPSPDRPSHFLQNNPAHAQHPAP